MCLAGLDYELLLKITFASADKGLYYGRGQEERIIPANYSLLFHICTKCLKDRVLSIALFEELIGFLFFQETSRVWWAIRAASKWLWLMVTKPGPDPGVFQRHW